jgi:hypothetical protein
VNYLCVFFVRHFGSDFDVILIKEKETLCACAFQQIAANLAIHALWLDQSSQGEIQQVVKSWPIGMFADADETIDVVPIQEDHIV